MKIIKMLLPLLVLLILASCSFLNNTSETKTNSVIDISKAGWKVTPFLYTSQFGNPFGSEHLKGDYWIGNMIFASCPTVCRVMTPNMITLQDLVNKEGIDLHFVSFTVDPEFDDPEGLKKYGQDYGADFSNYHFLTGYSQEEITEFSKESFKSIVQEIPESNDIMHSVNFFLVDGDGNVIRIYNGDKEFDAKSIIKDLKSTVR